MCRGGGKKKPRSQPGDGCAEALTGAGGHSRTGGLANGAMDGTEGQTAPHYVNGLSEWAETACAVRPILHLPPQLLFRTLAGGFGAAASLAGGHFGRALAGAVSTFLTTGDRSGLVATALAAFGCAAASHHDERGGRDERGGDYNSFHDLILPMSVIAYALGTCS